MSTLHDTEMYVNKLIIVSLMMSFGLFSAIYPAVNGGSKKNIVVGCLISAVADAILYMVLRYLGFI